MPGPANDAIITAVSYDDLGGLRLVKPVALKLAGGSFKDLGEIAKKYQLEAPLEAVLVQAQSR